MYILYFHSTFIVDSLFFFLHILPIFFSISKTKTEATNGDLSKAQDPIINTVVS
jgi:hypothetical protein